MMRVTCVDLQFVLLLLLTASGATGCALGEVSTATDEHVSSSTSSSTGADGPTTSAAGSSSSGPPTWEPGTTAPAEPVCGNGYVEAGEACDDGNVDDLDACTAMCALPACDDELLDGVESDVDCGGPVCVPCADGAQCASGADCASEHCAEGVCRRPRSCQEIKQADPDAPDGVYTVDPDGGGPAFQVFCDMTTDGGGWMMVLKLTSGVPGDPSALWQSGPVNEKEALLNVEPAPVHYVSSFVGKYWNQGGVELDHARVHVYQGGALAKFWKHNANGTDVLNWFSHSRLTESSYSDFGEMTPKFYSIDEEADIGRHFFINLPYKGCAADTGWLVVKSNAQSGTGPCVWDAVGGDPLLQILFAPHSTRTKWSTAIELESVGRADVLAVFVR